MNRNWMVRTPSGDYLVRVARGAESKTGIADPEQIWFFAACELEARLPHAIAAALEIYRELRGFPTTAHGAEFGQPLLEEVRLTLEREAHHGRLVFEPVRFPAVRKRLRQFVPIPAHAQPSREPEYNLDIVLLAGNGKPVGNCPYQLRLPSGEERTGKLDGRGSARLSAIPSGNYRIQFKEPEADQSAGG